MQAPACQHRLPGAATRPCASSSQHAALRSAGRRQQPAAPRRDCPGRPGSLPPPQASVKSAQTSFSVPIAVKGRHGLLTEALQQYVLDKVSHATERYRQTGIRRIEVKLSSRGTGENSKGAKEQLAEVTIWTKSHGVVRVEDMEENAYASIDTVCDKIRSKLRRMKGRQTESRHQRSQVHGVNEKSDDDWVMNDEEAQQMDLALEAPEAEVDPVGTLEHADAKDLVRVKRFPIDSLSVSEAITQVEQLSHDFYIFKEAKSGSLQVIYKRHQGGYGLIAPQ